MDRRFLLLIAGVLALVLAAVFASLGRQLPAAAEEQSFSVDQVTVQGLTLTLSGRWQPQDDRCDPNSRERYAINIGWGGGQQTEFPLPCRGGSWQASHTYAQPGVYTVCAVLEHVLPSGRDEVQAPCIEVSLGRPTPTATPTASVTPTATRTSTVTPTATGRPPVPTEPPVVSPEPTPRQVGEPSEGGESALRWGVVGAAAAALAALLAVVWVLLDAVWLYRG